MDKCNQLQHILFLDRFKWASAEFHLADSRIWVELASSIYNEYTYFIFLSLLSNDHFLNIKYTSENFQFFSYYQNTGQMHKFFLFKTYE